MYIFVRINLNFKWIQSIDVNNIKINVIVTIALSPSSLSLDVSVRLSIAEPGYIKPCARIPIRAPPLSQLRIDSLEIRYGVVLLPASCRPMCRIF